MARVKLAFAVQRASRARHIPPDRTLKAWALAALGRSAEVTLRYVAAAEGRRLNRRFRGKDHATNVLTFVHEGGRELAGDVVVCAPVVAREARNLGRQARAHHAHLLVHGLLHLQGYDHERSRDALKMERRERFVLRKLGFPDPYC